SRDGDRAKERRESDALRGWASLALFLSRPSCKCLLLRRRASLALFWSLRSCKWLLLHRWGRLLPFGCTVKENPGCDEDNSQRRIASHSKGRAWTPPDRRYEPA